MRCGKQGRRPDGKWTSPTIEVRGRELLRLSALRSQPKPKVTAAAMIQWPDAHHMASPRLASQRPISYNRSHCQRSECIAKSTAQNQLQYLRYLSLFTICEVRYSRHSMKHYDKCNVKFNLKYNLILLLNGLLNVQHLCFYNYEICSCDIYFEHFKFINYTDVFNIFTKKIRTYNL